jgi:hypothetical protein
MRRTEPEALAAATEAIISRRAACEDAARWAPPDDPFGLLGYLDTHRGVPQEVLAADAADALVVIRCLRAALNERERAFIHLSRDLGRKWRQIAGPLGLTSPQAAEQRCLRLDRWHETETRSDKQARRERAASASRPAWLAAHASEIRPAAMAVMLISPWLPSALSPAVTDLAEELGDPDATPAGLMFCLSALAYAYRYLAPDGYSEAALDRAAALAAEYDARSAK